MYHFNANSIIDECPMPGLNLIKLLQAYLGAYLSQANGIRLLNKPLKVLWDCSLYGLYKRVVDK